MFQEKIDSRALLAWTAAGIAAPIAGLFGSLPWPLVLAEGIGAAALWLAGWGKTPPGGKLLAGMQFVFLALAASLAAGRCGESWDGGAGSWVISLSLLLLSAWAASHGGDVVARCGAIVFLLSVFLYGVLFVSGVPDVEMEYLLPPVRWDGGLSFGVLLIPGILCFFPKKEGKRPWTWAAGLTVFAGALAALTVGCLSFAVASEKEGAFFQMVQGVSILGIAERFEALVSAVMTMGWFCLMSLFFTAGGHLTELLWPERGKWGVWVAAAIAAGLMHWSRWIPTVVFAGLAAVLWGFLPLFGKREKSSPET